jgi:hypothetical protein
LTGVDGMGCVGSTGPPRRARPRGDLRPAGADARPGWRRSGPGGGRCRRSPRVIPDPP